MDWYILCCGYSTLKDTYLTKHMNWLAMIILHNVVALNFEELDTASDSSSESFKTTLTKSIIL